MRDKGIAGNSELARRINAQPSLVSRWFHQDVMPRLETLQRLATALNTSPAFLLGSDASNPATVTLPSREASLLNESPLPYRIISNETLPSSLALAANDQCLAHVEQTIEEIRLRLVRWCSAEPMMKKILRTQIDTRLAEFEAVCGCQSSPAEPLPT